MLLAFAVGREIVFAFQARPATDVIGDVFSAVGSLRWVDTTLVTGLAAVMAASFSIYWVRRQIHAATDDTQRQIDHAAHIHREQREAKREAARTVLPLALSLICDYATTCARDTHDLLAHCVNDRLPQQRGLPVYPDIPQSPIDVLKEIVEYSDPEHRPVFTALTSKMQIQRARLRGSNRDLSGGFGVSKERLFSHIIDALEVYARAAALFAYARYEPDAVPETITPGSVENAIHSVGIFSPFTRDIAERAALHDTYELFRSD